MLDETRENLQGRMMKLVGLKPGITQKVLADELGIKEQMANYHLGRLENAGKVRFEKRGPFKHIYLDNTQLSELFP